MKKGVFLCTCSGTINLDFKKLRNSINADSIEVYNMLCQEPGKIKDVFERKDLSRALVACTSKKGVFEALDLDFSFINLREHCGWVHEREEGTEKAVALVRTALNCPEVGRKKIIDPGKDVLIIGPSSASIRIAKYMSGSADPHILITDAGDNDAPIHDGIDIQSGNVKYIEGRVGNFKINILRNPISPGKCISCRKCLNVCSLNAIYYSPVFAISDKCNRCGKCLDVCPTRAINFEDSFTTLKVGQVLAVGDNLNYPKGKKGFYITSKGKDVIETISLALPAAMEIIANTGGIEMGAPAKVILEGCAAGKSGFRGCSICERACRNGAIIRKDDTITFDEISCTGCGACSSVCPLSLFRMEDNIYSKMEYLLGESLFSNFKRNIITHKILMFTCEHNMPLLNTAAAVKIKYPPVLPLFVPDLARVSESHILRAFDLGAEGVIMFGCDECTNHIIEKSLILAGRILDDFKFGDRIKVIRNNNDVKGFAESLILFNEHIPAIRPGKNIPVKLTGASNRRVLLEIIASLVAKTGITPSSIIEDTTAPFADISIGTSCTVCGACTAMCPVGALIRDGGGIASIYSYCIACGLCEQACPEKALKLRRVLDMTKLLNTIPSTLFSSELQVCASCNNPYMTQAAFDRIISSFIENARGDFEPRGQVELIKNQIELLKYCENCRPKRAILKMEMLA